MKIKHLTYLIICGAFIFSCKKDDGNTNNTGNNTPRTPSKMELLTKEWTLKETYKDGTLQTSNGTDQYRFDTNGKFMFKDAGTWKEIGTYKFNDKDSNSISTLFTGMSMSYWMELKKLDDKNCQTEFMANGHKLQYDYVR